VFYDVGFTATKDPFQFNKAGFQRLSPIHELNAAYNLCRFKFPNLSYDLITADGNLKCCLFNLLTDEDASRKINLKY